MDLKYNEHDDVEVDSFDSGHTVQWQAFVN